MPASTRQAEISGDYANIPIRNADQFAPTVIGSITRIVTVGASGDQWVSAVR